MRPLIFQFGSYSLASAAAFALDVGLLWVMVNVAGWHYLLAALISFIAGGVLLHKLSVKFVFQQRRVNNQTLELSCFLGLGIVGLLINLVVMYVAVDGMRAPLLVAKVCAAGCTICVNFLLRKQLLFSRGVIE